MHGQSTMSLMLLHVAEGMQVWVVYIPIIYVLVVCTVSEMCLTHMCSALSAIEIHAFQAF